MALEAVVALESGLEEFYQLRRPLFEGDVSTESCLALVVMKRQGGLLVAAPFLFLSSEDKAALNLLGEKSSIGPRTSLTVPAEKEIEGGGRETALDIEVLVFDLDAAMATQLVPLREVSEEDQENMMGYVEEDSHIVPESDALLKFATEGRVGGTSSRELGLLLCGRGTGARGRGDAKGSWKGQEAKGTQRRETQTGYHCDAVRPVEWFVGCPSNSIQSGSSPSRRPAEDEAGVPYECIGASSEAKSGPNQCRSASSSYTGGPCQPRRGSIHSWTFRSRQRR